MFIVLALLNNSLQVDIHEMMGFCFVLEQKGELDVYIASSLKQQSTDGHTLDDGLLFCSRPTG